MAVTVTQYGRMTESLLEGRISTIADEVWCMLVTSAYTFNKHTHKFKSVITGEVIGSGYAAGGQHVTTSALVYDSATSSIKLPSGNLAWPAVTFTGVVGAVLYMKPDGIPENAMPLLSYIAFGESVSRSTEAFYINWPTTGVIKLAVP